MSASPVELDPVQVRRAFSRAAGAAGRAMIAREIERRMVARLDYIRYRPRRILDAGTGEGEGLALLGQRFRDAELIGLDVSHALLRRARRRSLWWWPRLFVAGRAPHWICGDFARLPLANASVGMVWSNLALAWAREPLAALREFQRVLVEGGLLMFSSYGPDTLKELRAAFGSEAARRVHSFADMHDLGDMLLACGFGDPVMDMEMITLTYPSVEALARDLRASGQTCALRDRPRGLTGRGTWQRMLSAYERMRSAGRLPATMEIVYGLGWKTPRRVLADGRSVVQWPAPRGFRR